jgi:L-fuconolactonase
MTGKPRQAHRSHSFMVKIIDTHPHVVSSDIVRYPITPLGEKRSDWSHERSISTEELIAAMDAAGVDQAAVVHSSTTYGFNCAYLVDSVAAHPDRFTGVFSVNLLAADAPERMREWYAKGLTGMRMYVKGTTVKQAIVALDDPKLFPVYQCAEENDITMALNVQGTEGFAQLAAVLRRFPKVRFFLDHAGRADYSSGPPFDAAAPLLKLSAHPNLYLKITSVNFLSKGRGWEEQSAAIVQKLVSTFGANRLAWGSNYPASEGTLPELVEVAKTCFSTLSRQDQEWLLHKTARHLYPKLAARDSALS